MKSRRDWLMFGLCLSMLLGAAPLYAQDSNDNGTDPSIAHYLKTFAAAVFVDPALSPAEDSTGIDVLHMAYFGPGKARLAGEKLELGFDVLKPSGEKIGQAIVKVDNPLRVSKSGYFRGEGRVRGNAWRRGFDMPLRFIGQVKKIRPWSWQRLWSNEAPEAKPYYIIRGQFYGREEVVILDEEASTSIYPPPRPAIFRGRLWGREIKWQPPTDAIDPPTQNRPRPRPRPAR